MHRAPTGHDKITGVAIDFRTMANTTYAGAYFKYASSGW